MNNEENFYDILRSKFKESEAPFDEENWKSMRQMIDASRAAKKRALWLVASLSLLLCAGGAGTLYHWGYESAKSNTVAVVSNNGKAIMPSAISGQLNNSANPAGTSNSSAIINNSNQAAAPGSAVAAQNQPLANVNITMAAVASSYKKSDKNSRHIAASGSPIAVNNTVSSANNGQNSSIQNSRSSMPASGKQVSINQAATSAKLSPASNSSVLKATAAVAQTHAHKADSAAAIASLPQRFSDEPRIFGGKTNLFSIEAGGEYSGGWQIGSAIQGQGFNPFIGVGYEHYMGSRIFLKAGLQFLDFGHMSPITYNYQHSVGNVIYDSVITTRRLYFIRIPIQAEYFIGRKRRSSVGIGGSVWFLMGNSGFATTYQQVDNNPPENIIQYSQNTPLDGYSKVNVSAHILYRYMLSKKFSVYGIMYFEMTSMMENSFFGDNIIERTKGVQFTLSYNLN